MESKLLDPHPDKSCYIVAGEKKARMKMKKKLAAHPLLLYNNNMKEVENNKYLGCLLSRTVSQSVTDTVNSRIGLARRAIYEIRTIIEDSRAGVIGSIKVGLSLWEMSVIPMLLYSSEVWSDIPAKTMRKLEETNSLMLSNLLGVSKRGCPEVSLYLEMANLTVQNQKLLRKMLFIHRVATLPNDSLASECYEEMLKHSLPGIVSNCVSHMNQWGITNIRQYSKWSWKKLMKEKIKLKNFQDLLKQSERYKKIDTELYRTKAPEMKSYLKTLNLEDARILFRKNSFMLKTVRYNFKSDKHYKAEGYLCPDCLALDPPVSHPDNQEELLTCQGNLDLRLNRDMSDQKHEARYYRELIERRIQNHGG